MDGSKVLGSSSKLQQQLSAVVVSVIDRKKTDLMRSHRCDYLFEGFYDTEERT